MPNTTRRALPYPSLSDAPNGPSQIQALAQRLDDIVGTEPRHMWHIPRGGDLITAYPTGSFINMQIFTIPNAPAGDYVLSFGLVISNGISTPGEWQFKAGTDAYGSAADIFVPNVRHTFSPTVGYNHPATGNLVIQSLHFANNGTPVIHLKGTWLTAAYLGRRAT